jgi:hypothetical protein
VVMHCILFQFVHAIAIDRSSMPPLIAQTRE